MDAACNRACTYWTITSNQVSMRQPLKQRRFIDGYRFTFTFLLFGCSFTKVTDATKAKPLVLKFIVSLLKVIVLVLSTPKARLEIYVGQILMGHESSTNLYVRQ